MISALGLVALSALLGGSLALAARRRPILLELTRTFAFAAALGVVAFHLVPEIMPRLGPEAFVWIAGGFALPWILEAGARALGPGFLSRRGMHGFRVAAEVAFIALVFHSVVEGLALLALVQSSSRAADVQLAILAHHAPLTAAVALPFLELQGARSAAARVALVGLSGAAGIVLGQLVPGLATGADAAVVQRATALTAGALLHVVSDEIREQRFAASWQRALDMLACALGFGLAGLGAFFDLPNAQGIVNVAHASVALGLAVAPALVAGLVVRWATMRFAPRAAEPSRAAAAGIFAVWALLGFASAAIRLVLGALFWSVGSRLSPLRPLRPLPLADEYAARAPPVLALFVLAAGADALAPPGFFASRAPVLVALALAAFSQASASGAALAAAALVHRGLPANLAIPFLALGSLPLGRAVFARGAAIAAGGVAVALLAGAALSRTDLGDRAQRAADASFAASREAVSAQLAAAPIESACLAVVVALGLAMVYRKGVRGWFLPLRHPDLRITVPSVAAAPAGSEATR
ncbi:MAG TPA: ZIP family metal transporter [Myxococcales bacterium]|nr:ZIP family metal transporter [Myxococcales bacterium]